MRIPPNFFGIAVDLRDPVLSPFVSGAGIVPMILGAELAAVAATAGRVVVVTFSCPALTAEDSLSKYTSTYAYEYSDENAPERYLAPVGFPYGAAHASEVQYLFSLSNTPYPGTLSAAQQARTMQRYWTNLARTGTPTGHWPRFTGANQQTLSLAPPRPQMETGYAAEHHCAFWAAAG